MSIKRLKTLDTLRGIAVVIMLYHHFLNWLFEGKVIHIFPRMGGIVFPNHLALGLFLLVTGIGLPLAWQKKGGDLKTKVLLSGRLLFYFFLGFIINLIIWDLRRATTLVNALQMIVISDLIVLWLIGWRLSGKMLILIGIFSALSYYPIHPYSSYLPSFLKHLFFGVGPLQVYLLLVLVGACIGNYLLNNGLDKRLIRNLRGGGLFFITLSLILHYAGYETTRTPFSLSFLFLVLGTPLFLLSILFKFEDFQYRAVRGMRGDYVLESKILNLFKIYGRNALNLYAFHFIVFKGAKLLGFYGYFTAGISLFLAFGLLSLFSMGAYILERKLMKIFS